MYNLEQLLNPDFKVQPEMSSINRIKEPKTSKQVFYTTDHLVERICEMTLGVTLTEAQANRLHSRIAMATKIEERQMATHNFAMGPLGRQMIIEGLSEEEKSKVKTEIVKASMEAMQSQESVYRKIIKHLLSIKHIGYKEQNNVYAIYSQNGFITNIEARDSNEALDKAVDELVKITAYA